MSWEASPVKSSAPPVLYSYVRLSSSEQRTGLGAGRQTKLAEDYAKAHGLTLSPETFHDLGLSAFTGKHRTHGALARFVALVEQGKIPRGSVLGLDSLDRFSRE
jgi:DNA invertase Pin-like site-specific DNA recombinase